MLQKIGFKGKWSIFTTSIKSECFDFGGELSFNHGFKKNKLGKDFKFRLKLVNPSKSYKVINKQNIISKAICWLNRCRNPHIRVYKFKRRRYNKLRFWKWKIMHFTIQTMCTRIIQISILIQYRLEIRKKKFENLIMRMTKPHMPECFIENSGLSSIVTNFRTQSELRSFVRIDGINSIFTLALVEYFPLGQSLNWKDIFIKIIPTFVTMIDFIDRSKIWGNERNSKHII